MPGSSKPADLGANPGYSVSNLPDKQETQSIESAQTVITEEPEQRESHYYQTNLQKNNMSLQLAL